MQRLYAVLLFAFAFATGASQLRFAIGIG